MMIQFSFGSPPQYYSNIEIKGILMTESSRREMKFSIMSSVLII